MDKFSNKLSDAEAERLHLLIEECSEVQKAATKILRHGYESSQPHWPTHNRQQLERELGDLGATVSLMVDRGDVNPTTIDEAEERHRGAAEMWLHHNTFKPDLSVHVEEHNRRMAALVDRFLSWELPTSVCSDACATDAKYAHLRHGTNLLTADETRQMLEYVLDSGEIK